MIRIVFGSLFILAAGVGIVIADAVHQLRQPLRLEQETLLLIEPGQPFVMVTGTMKAQGWFGSSRTALYLRAYLRLNDTASRIKAGEYRLVPGMTVLQAVDLFVSGSNVLHELRLIEGWTFAQALTAVRGHPQLRQTLVDADGAAVLRALGRPDVHPEGRLFPDTYRFARGTTDLAFLRRAVDTLERVLAAEWEQRSPGLPYASAEEALIMASIIEKETGVPEERGQIAGVFVRRLRQGMRLQTDPTVIYGLGDAFDGNLRLRDLRTDTPYNTYTRGGLPPSPICLAGQASIHAALHPQDGQALFFVSRGDGTHEFSETLEQHNAAVRRYQLGGK